MDFRQYLREMGLKDSFVFASNGAGRVSGQIGKLNREAREP